MLNKNVITIATGKKLYLDLAINLYHSFIFWNKHNDIQFYLITDIKNVSPLIYDKFNLISVYPGELGEGFSPKLYLDKLAPEGQTLFIDSDCLIFGELSNVFEKFKDHAVSVVGGYISEGEWFGDVSKICKQFKIYQMPKFNGGIYYLENGIEANVVYETARGLEKKYDEIGFTLLRNKPNDEVIMSLAMALHQQKPVPDDGTFMSDPQACPGPYQLDLIKGETLLINPQMPHPKHQAWYPFHQVSPLIVHFLGYYTEHYPYKREVARLNKKLNSNLNLYSEVLIYFKIELPERLKIYLKNAFRPFYRSIFGIRKAKLSNRL